MPVDFAKLLKEQRKLCKCGLPKSKHSNQRDPASGKYYWGGLGKGAALGEYLGTKPSGEEEWEILCPGFEEVQEGGGYRVN
jgi:hypothetical protein